MRIELLLLLLSLGLTSLPSGEVVTGTVGDGGCYGCYGHLKPTSVLRLGTVRRSIQLGTKIMAVVVAVVAVADDGFA